MTSDPLLSVENLTVTFSAPHGEVAVVRGVTFDVRPGETVGVIGESGSGKTMTALAVMRLVPELGSITRGRVLFEGRDLLAAREQELDRIRGKRVGMIFQSPQQALNPLMTVGEQLGRVFRHRLGVPAPERNRAAIRSLQAVSIPEPERVLRTYAHQLSGGMAQRVLIAMMVASRPALLIADEPTTALDVTTQAQILALLKRIQAETGMAILLISHDLGVVAEQCERVVVMYGGQVMERGDIRTIFRHARHPYTGRLLASFHGEETGPLSPAGELPQRGCAFQGVCPHAIDVCRGEVPEPFQPAPAHDVMCHWVAGKAGMGS